MICISLVAPVSMWLPILLLTKLVDFVATFRDNSPVTGFAKVLTHNLWLRTSWFTCQLQEKGGLQIQWNWGSEGGWDRAFCFKSIQGHRLHGIIYMFAGFFYLICNCVFTYVTFNTPSKWNECGIGQLLDTTEKTDKLMVKPIHRVITK